MTERAMYLSHAGTLFYVPRVRGSAAVAKLGNGARFRVSSRRGFQVRILAAASSVRFGKHFRPPPPGKTKPTGGIPLLRGMKMEIGWCARIRDFTGLRHFSCWHSDRHN